LETDGTAVGTTLVKDINPGPGNSYPSNFTLFNGLIYFNAYDDTHGYELWKTDGTSANTSLVQDIASGTTSSSPSYLTAIGTSYLVFSAYDATDGTELRSYNGTTISTFDIVSGTNGSNPYSFAYNGSKALFIAYSGAVYNVYYTDGTTYSQVTGTYQYPNSLAAVGGTIYFEAYDATYGYELWSSSGTTAARISDINSLTGSSYPGGFVASGSYLFFSAYNGTNYYLYYTSGGAPTVVGTTATNPYSITSYGSGNVAFEGYTAANGYELWKATVTGPAESLVADIQTGSASSYPSNMTFAGSYVFFSADDGTHGQELWLTDFSTTTTMVKDINTATDSNISIQTPTSAGYLMSAYDGTQQEIWKTDITTGGTAKVSSINPGSYAYPNFLGKTGSSYIFSAYNATYGYEPWKTDGVSTYSIVTDIYAGANSSYPQNGAVMGGYVYFVAYDGTYGYELRRTDGTTTTLIKDIYPGTNGSYPQYLTVIGSTLYFTADDGTNGNEVWKSDGTSGGTTLVKNINLSGGSYPNSLTALGTTLYFNASDGSNGYELWKSDGTSLGTTLVKDINPSGDSYPQSLTVYNSTLYFTANDGTTGVELWKSDGTSGGTVQVKDIVSGANSSYPSALTVAGSWLYFNAYTSANGYELWQTDGTSANTNMVKDIYSGTLSSNISNLTNINSTLYFTATDITGTLLYKSNGSAAGTIPATSAGIVYDSPGKSYYYNGKLIFNANTNTYGNEPLTVMAEPLNQPTTLNFGSVSSSSISGSFTAAVASPSAPAGYVVMRKIGSAPTDMPVDGTPYSVGATVGTSTVAAIGAGTTFTDNFTGTSNPSAYYYAIYSYNNDGTANIYRPTSPLTGNSTPPAVAPSAQPTALNATSVTTTSFTVSFTAASGSPTGYLVLEKSGSTAPTDLPVNGTGYIAGATLGSSNIAYVGSATTFPQTSLTSGSYSYAVFSYNGSTGTYTYLTSSPLKGTLATLAATPTAQPSGLGFSGATSSSINGSFTAASGSPAGYLVIRNTVAPVDVPANGTAYTAGASLGASVVVYSGSGTNFNDTGLSPGTAYYYAVFSFNGSNGTTSYLTTSPLSSNGLTLSTQPANQPTGFVYSSVTSTSYTVSFVAASSAPNGYIILRVAGATPPTDVPVNGTGYSIGATIGASTVVAYGSGTSFNETGLAAGAQYSYAIFSGNGTGNTATNDYLTTSPLTGTAAALANAPSAQPTALTFSATQTNAMTLSWTAAAGTPTGYLVLRKSGSAPTGAPQAGSSYTAGTTLGDGTVAYSGTAVTFNDSGLSSATSYYYQVFSVNGSGISSNYLTASPLSKNNTTLDVEPTVQPTNLVFSSVGVTSLTGTFSASANAPVTGYLVIRNTTAPTSVPQDGTTYALGATLTGTDVVAYVGSNNSFSETTLTGATKYFYTVFAYNNANGPINYLATNPLTGNVTTQTADTTPPTVTNSTGSNATPGINVTISATVTDTGSGVASVSLKYRSISGDGTYTTVSMTSGSNNSWQYAVPSSQVGEIGLEYIFVATDNQANTFTSASPNTVLVSYASQSIPYGSFGTDQTNYRIVALPLNLPNNTANSVFSSLGAYDNTKWRLFHYSNAANTELSGSSTLKIGDGYWLIAKTQATISLGTGTAVNNVDASTPFVINLVQGWNQIGNPYLFNVSWTDIQSASNNTLTVKTYNGTWNTGDRLHTFEGGFVFAGQAATLKIPTQKNSQVQTGRIASANNELQNSISSSDWEVTLKLKNNELTYNLGGFGMRTSANVDYDQFDDYTLPRMMDYLELNHEKTFANIHYSRDIVPTSENHIWNFSVDSNKGGITEINWDNSYFGNSNSLGLALVDLESKTVIDMKSSNGYSFESARSRNFKIVYGSLNFVKENALPDELVINTVYPNPSSSSVSVGFSTPNYQGETLYNVNVINMMGQPVGKIFLGSLAAGTYEFTWDGNDATGSRVAQGLYFVEVRSAQQNRATRIVIK
jgi:ELWxxDGT repeat protein